MLVLSWARVNIMQKNYLLLEEGSWVSICLFGFPSQELLARLLLVKYSGSCYWWNTLEVEHKAKKRKSSQPMLVSIASSKKKTMPGHKLPWEDLSGYEYAEAILCLFWEHMICLRENVCSDIDGHLLYLFLILLVWCPRTVDCYSCIVQTAQGQPLRHFKITVLYMNIISE